MDSLGPVVRERVLLRHRGKVVSVLLANGHPSGMDIEVTGLLLGLCGAERSIWLRVEGADVHLPLRQVIGVTERTRAGTLADSGRISAA
jgi:hypothetical protein